MSGTSVTERIREKAREMAEGEILSAKALLHLGSRASVDQALSRLAREGVLVRVGRGLYSPVVRSAFGERAPRHELFVWHWAEHTGETVAPSGLQEARAFGLTTQVPVRAVYLTSGRTRRLRAGAVEVEMRHAPPWLLHGSGSPVGKAIRALEWMGAEHAPAAIAKIRALLPAEEVNSLLAARPLMPLWLAQAVSSLATVEQRA